MQTTVEAEARSGRITRASLAEMLGVLADVAIPTFAKGVLIRRPKAVALVERSGLGRRAVRRLQALRRTHGDGLLLLPTPVRPQAVVLSVEDARRILSGAPEPFTPATLEKRSALAHFEPRVSLVSDPPERAERRAFNDALLESGSAQHSMAEVFRPVLRREAAEVLHRAGSRLVWTAFTRAWHRAVRAIVLGGGARGDETLTETLDGLRAAGNLAFLRPRRTALFTEFRETLARHLDRAEPDSLAQRIAARGGASPIDQVTHWLFAFDAAGNAAYRALALLAAHPAAQEQARAEAGSPDHAYLRACFMESLRLWPTTPAILRETTEDVDWPGGPLRKGTHLLIFAPFFHRDGERLPEADRFAPELWLEPERRRGALFLPFSAGPATCPAHHLVPLLAAEMLAAMLGRGAFQLEDPDALRLDRPMPSELDHFGLALRLAARTG